MEPKYVGVSLYIPIAEKIDDAVKKNWRFSSRAGFIRYAVQKELERLEGMKKIEVTP